MTGFWEAAFHDKQVMWGLEPAQSAVIAGEHFARAGAKHVLIPGIGYGRNAGPFIDRGSIDEPSHGGASFPFLSVTCANGPSAPEGEPR